MATSSTETLSYRGPEPSEPPAGPLFCVYGFVISLRPTIRPDVTERVGRGLQRLPAVPAVHIAR